MISAPVTFLFMDVKTAHVPSGAKVKLFERSEAKMCGAFQVQIKPRIYGVKQA